MNLFNLVGNKRPRTNVFDLSHDRKFTLRMGELVPFFCQDVIPGDKWRMNTEVFMRLVPLLAPVMHRVNVYTHFFFVPYRLLWDNWQNFITGGEDGNAVPLFPRLDSSLIDSLGDDNFLRPGSLWDYFGFPTLDVASMPPSSLSLQVSALPFRAYQLIYNEFYRDQDLVEKVGISKADGIVNTGDEIANLLSLRNRAWEKDYFTSARPFAQKGGEAGVPLSIDSNVIWNEDAVTDGNRPIWYRDDGPTVANGTATFVSGELQDRGAITGADTWMDPNGTLKVASSEGDVMINDLRRAVKLQEWLERNARGGSRYIESILSHFGVRSSDARLQRPEFLGGGRSAVSISEVLQTSSTDSATSSSTPQGNMSGHGISVGNSHSFKKFIEEHGVIIGIMSVLPRTCYQQGVPRQFTKFDKFEFAWPEFAHLGEQEVFNKELYFDYNPLTTLTPEGTFGYQSRYSEYKYIPSSVHGDFKTSLDYWHFGRKFTRTPLLNDSFVSAFPTERPFAVQGEDVLLCQVYNNVRAVRPLPRMGTPGL